MRVTFWVFEVHQLVLHIWKVGERNGEDGLNISVSKTTFMVIGKEAKYTQEIGRVAVVGVNCTVYQI